eukprot:jgi/Chrpa1/6830/Chrysochromulina_OHIO_Genome00010681-RA
MSLACLRSAQHAAPTGTWCVGVSVRLRPDAVVSTTKVVLGTSASASERSETVSVVRVPSAVAATMASPARSALRGRGVPSAIVTSASLGKHGALGSLQVLRELI